MSVPEPPEPEPPMMDVVDGRRVVVRAEQQILLVPELANRELRKYGAQTPIAVEEDGTVTLDDAGEYRYRLLGHDRWRRHVGIYQRI